MQAAQRDAGARVQRVAVDAALDPGGQPPRGGLPPDLLEQVGIRARHRELVKLSLEVELQRFPERPDGAAQPELGAGSELAGELDARGSGGVGPGTGGGTGTNHPPTPTQFFLPPLPAPPSLRGYHLIAWFDVDEKGNSKLLGFNPSRDGGYNRKLRDVLSALRFRPGTRPDGTPVRDTVDIHFIF